MGEITIKPFLKTDKIKNILKKLLVPIILFVYVIFFIILGYIIPSYIDPPDDIYHTLFSSILSFFVFSALILACCRGKKEYGDTSIVINKEGIYFYDVKSNTPKFDVNWNNFQGIKRKAVKSKRKRDLKASYYCIITYFDNVKNQSEYSFTLEHFNKSSNKIWKDIIKAINTYLPEGNDYIFSDEKRIVTENDLKKCRKQDEHKYKYGVVCPDCSKIMIKPITSKEGYFQFSCPSCSEKIQLKVGIIPHSVPYTSEIKELKYELPYKSGFSFILLVCIYIILVNIFLSMLIYFAGMMILGLILSIFHFFLIWLFNKKSKDIIKNKKGAKSFTFLNYFLNVMFLILAITMPYIGTFLILFFSIGFSIIILKGFQRSLIAYYQIYKYHCQNCYTSFTIAADEKNIFILEKL